MLAISFKWFEAGEMARQVGVLATLSVDPDSVPSPQATCLQLHITVSSRYLTPSGLLICIEHKLTLTHINQNKALKQLYFLATSGFNTGLKQISIFSCTFRRYQLLMYILKYRLYTHVKYTQASGLFLKHLICYFSHYATSNWSILISSVFPPLKILERTAFISLFLGRAQIP